MTVFMVLWFRLTAASKAITPEKFPDLHQYLEHNREKVGWAWLLSTSDNTCELLGCRSSLVPWGHDGERGGTPIIWANPKPPLAIAPKPRFAPQYFFLGALYVLYVLPTSNKQAPPTNECQWILISPSFVNSFSINCCCWWHADV